MIRIKRYTIFFLAVLSLHPLFAEEIIIGVEPIPQRTMAFIFTPLVLTDPVSAKAAFEYRLNPKFNLVIPVEAQWMNYRWAIKLFSKKYPEELYKKDARIKPGWNINYSHFVVATGLGLKAFPFSESMTNAFFLKSTLLAGIERYNAFAAEGVKEGAVITFVLSMGYNWVKGNVFTFGGELGFEHTYHSNPIEKLPSLFNGFAPILQFSVGFLI